MSIFKYAQEAVKITAYNNQVTMSTVRCTFMALGISYSRLNNQHLYYKDKERSKTSSNGKFIHSTCSRKPHRRLVFYRYVQIYSTGNTSDLHMMFIRPTSTLLYTFKRNANVWGNLELQHQIFGILISWRKKTKYNNTVGGYFSNCI